MQDTEDLGRADTTLAPDEAAKADIATPPPSAPSGPPTDEVIATLSNDLADARATIQGQREYIANLEEENAFLKTLIPAEAPLPEAPAATADVDETPRVGLWECLNEPRFCELAAPDPRTPAKPFEGPTQDVVRGENITVTCPSCKGEKVLYRGEKTDAAVAA